jgi:hypothetical protein
MKSFLDYLVEEKGKADKAKDLTDMMLHDNNEGVGIVAANMKKFHDHLLGKESNSHEFHTHYNGHHGIAFGKHPTNKQFFVSIPGENPNFTHEDIDVNHGHDAKVSNNLKTALTHLPKIMPKSGGVYHATVMHTKSDITSKDNHHHMTPHDTTYSAHKDTAHGKKMKAAHIGIAVTHHEKNGEVMPLDKKTRVSFEDHPDVHHINTSIKANPANYSPQKQKEFLTHYGLATTKYRTMDPGALDSIKGHEVQIGKHINKMNKDGVKASADTYIDHLTNKYQDGAKPEKYNDLAKTVFDNKNHFQKIIDFHQHLNDAKHTLLDVASVNEPFMHSKKGAPAEPMHILSVDKNGKIVKFGRNR